jgi:putative protease
MKNLEILAPAGNLDSLKVAINSGANAVYLGLQNFNARNKADNFTEENIKQVVEYCHLRDVKVYLTVNTLIKNEETEQLLNMIRVCINAKVDAYIVQDYGVAYLLKHTFKNINLHASTQMGIHNLMGAKVAEKFGFSRVVLSRETTLEDILQISQETNLEIEYFVQGALCVAFSGNCYLSSLCHSESGNRGRCLQLCRLKYKAILDGKQINNGYLLSPTDLSLVDKLQLLQKAGVTSLKIEGRNRRPGYVGAVVKEYFNAINGLSYDKASFEKSFYRGKYNDGLYLQNKNPNV